jgi:hypothetical protein
MTQEETLNQKILNKNNQEQEGFGSGATFANNFLF